MYPFLHINYNFSFPILYSAMAYFPLFLYLFLEKKILQFWQICHILISAGVGGGIGAGMALFGAGMAEIGFIS